MSRSILAAHAVVGAVVLAALAAPTSALACGGFFCMTTPIDQSSEKIVFAVDEGEGTVETHVQISYQGAAQEFSWIVPVPSVPELGLSTDSLFQAIDWQMAPQWFLNWEERGTCEYDVWVGGGGVFEDVAADGAGGPPSAGAEGGVTVIAEQEVGPFQSVTLAATDSAELLTWLADNGYTIPPDVAPSLDPYIADGSYFIALKLLNDADAGDITPIKFTYQASAPMIPLVLTRIAATPDMRVQPVVFAQHRAVPDNYLHVRINEAAINWLNYGSNYSDVITQAANEAGGKAFATDYAGTTQNFRGYLFQEGRFDLDYLAALTDPAQFVMAMLDQGFPRTAQVQNLIREFIPMPQDLIDQGIPESEFYNCLDCFRADLAGIDFDPVAFAAALGERVVAPLEEAESLYTRFPYVTRMTSSMSAEEMDADAYFVLNADMGDQSNSHAATHITDCGAGAKISEAPHWIELADGTQILLPPWGTSPEYGVWDTELGANAAAVIEDASATGEPVPVSDQSEAIADSLTEHNQGVSDIYGAAGTELPEDLDLTGDAGCGCDQRGAPTAPALGLLGLAALASRRRRA
jgi:MYXO-CTERM domain-containing protein